MQSINSTKTRSRFGQPGSEGLKSESSYTFAVAEWRLEIKKRKTGQSWFFQSLVIFLWFFRFFLDFLFDRGQIATHWKENFAQNFFRQGKGIKLVPTFCKKLEKWVTTIWLVLRVSGSILTKRVFECALKILPTVYDPKVTNFFEISIG